MSRIGVFIPCHGADGAACVKQSIEAAHCYTGLRVVKLRDRTGPSVAERLARLETEHAALVVRVGELERLPEASEDSDATHMLAALRSLGDGDARKGFAAVMGDGEPAHVRPEPGSTSWQRVKSIQAIDDGERVVAATREQIEAYLRSRPDQWREGDEPGLWLCEDEGYYLGAASDRAALAKRLGLAASSTTAKERDALLARAEKAERELAIVRRHAIGAYNDAASRDAELEAAEKLLPAQFRCEPALLHEGIGPLVADWQKRGEDITRLRTRAEKAEDFLARIANGARAVSTAELLQGDIVLARAEGRVFVCPDGTGCALVPVPEEPTAPDATRDPLTDPREGDWFVDPDGCITEITGVTTTVLSLRWLFANGHTSDDRCPFGEWPEMCQNESTRPMTPAEVAAFKANAARPSAPTPIVRVPIESAGADGARLSEHRMCSDLAADGMSPFYAADGSRRWMRRFFATPSDIESAPTTAVAYAAMRAAKGAPPATTEPTLPEKEAFLRSKGWTNEEPYGWHCPGVEGTSDTNKAYALAKGAR